MDCCAKYVSSAERCFGWMSKRYEKRYATKGLDEHQRQMVAALGSAGIDAPSVLDIGCGVGMLHRSLLEQGASRAQGVDIAPRMLELAREHAHSEGYDERTRYLLGDFVELADQIEPADITLLDKVVCCYPAPRELLDAASERTYRLMALTYPRRHLISRFWNALWNFGFWVMRSDFRGFVHEPAMVRRVLQTHGFELAHEYQSILWTTEIYRRRDESGEVEES